MNWYVDTKKLTERQSTEITLQLYENTKTIGKGIEELLNNDIIEAKKKNDNPEKIKYMEDLLQHIEKGIEQAEAGIKKYLQQLN